MEVALEHLLPKISGEIEYEFRRFQCKDELLHRLPERLEGLASWLPATWAVLVVTDRDDDDCSALKARLESIAAKAGLLSKTRAGVGRRFQVVNRIAVEELEAWFFGDWQAVQAAYPRVPRMLSSKAAFRNPDAILGGTWEALERVMKRAGYFRSGLRKLEFARTVAAHMEPARNSSRSFQHLCGAVAASIASRP